MLLVLFFVVVTFFQKRKPTNIHYVHHYPTENHAHTAIHMHIYEILSLIHTNDQVRYTQIESLSSFLEVVDTRSSE